MKRDLNKLSSEQYDVLIIGGGVYGVSTAWDAALRGLKVALIEKGDFAGATSSNSLKTIHGGLRYLQSLDFRRMRQSIHERMVLMKIAPQFVFPLSVIMPTYGYKMKSRSALFMALLANDLIGFDRNRLSDTDKILPGGRLLSKEEMKEYVPGYENKEMSGGALWYDCQCVNTERLVLSYALSASGTGAQVANYVECTDFLSDGNGIRGVKARDILSDDTFDIQAKIVVNAGGPWIDEILKGLNGGHPEKRFIHSSAMNIVVKKRLLSRHAAGLPGPYQYKREDGTIYKGSQILFFLPWRDCTIIGTNHLPYYGETADFRIGEPEIKSFISKINQTYPAADIKREEISFVHQGLLPMTGVRQDSGMVNLEAHYRIYDHSIEDKIDGLITVVGVKYTTHRQVAGKTIDLIFEKFNKTSPQCTTEDRPLYGGDMGRFSDYLSNAVAESGRDEKVVRHLVHNYGTGYGKILQYIDEDPGLMQTIPGSSEVIRAEVLNSIRNEMALKLSDVVLRRTDLGSAENPGDEALNVTAEIMGKELAWDEARTRKEVEETIGFYVPADY